MGVFNRRIDEVFVGVLRKWHSTLIRKHSGQPRINTNKKEQALGRNSCAYVFIGDSFLLLRLTPVPIIQIRKQIIQPLDLFEPIFINPMFSELFV